MSANPRSHTLGFGQFFGRPDTRHELAGFSLARITASTPPAKVPDHVHETAHLVLVLEGAYLTSAERIEPGRDAALVYNPPGTVHRDRFRDPRGVFFTLSVSERRLSALGSGDVPARPVALSSGTAVRLARRLHRAGESWPPRSSARAEALCMELLASVLDGAGRDRPQPPGWLVSARRTIAARYGDPLRVEDLAAFAEVHPVHLIRSFRRFFGLTPGEFLRERRLAAAAALLRTTRLAIADIALQTGFVDQSHLTKVFTRGFALPPAAYRRLHGPMREH